jgi:hypothetical protein
MTRARPDVLAIAAAVALGIVAAVGAQPEYDVKAHYAKRELYIPMRDGV